MALSQLKPGQIKVTMANQTQMRQLQMQQYLGIPRKIRMTQIPAAGQAGAGGAVIASNAGATQESGVASAAASAALSSQKSSGTAGGGVQTQLVHIQNPKSLSSLVTVQQIQQVMRQQGQQGSLGATGLVLGKTSVGRVITVSASPSQVNQRQTIQVSKEHCAFAS